MTKKLAICFSTKDRVELSEQSLPVLRNGFALGKHDLFLLDGSRTDEGLEFFNKQATSHSAGKLPKCWRVTGGADAAIVAGLTFMLDDVSEYTHVGLVENDVLLHPDWLGPTLALFDRGEAEGLRPGAVSARCYEDRILCQRDGYALTHNLGAGVIILTREAARIALNTFRTHWSTDNRRTFMQLAGYDIAKHWAFRGNEHFLCADWGIDMELARHGLASLALTPSPVEMIGQVPPLHEQGLKLADQPVEWLRDDKRFEAFELNSALIRNKVVSTQWSPFHYNSGIWTIFPHQLYALGKYTFHRSDWILRWRQGFGPFVFEAKKDAEIEVCLSGPCSFIVSGGANGGRVQIEDLASGYKMSPFINPEVQPGMVMNLVVPASVSYRPVRLTALDPGVIFYGITVQEPQPWRPGFQFDWHCLPPAE